jgi:alcohol dehydrogenase class IV
MHHGLANAVMIPYGMEFNAGVSARRMKTIARTIGLADESAEGFITWLKELNRKLGIPANLKDLGVKPEQVEALSTLAIQDPCHGSNERPVTREDFVALYRKAVL